ncbi:MAG: hypothetical protein V7631_854 [Massilia sp.]|jgi:hypothetical protein
MKRGMFAWLINNDAYKKSEKDWLVELQMVQTYWYGLLDDRRTDVPVRQALIEYLARLRREIEESLEKRFIYFIMSHKRVRFDTSRKPRFEFFSRMLKLGILVGRERKRMTVNVDFGFSRRDAIPHVEISEDFITFSGHDGAKQTMSVHDFLSIAEINLGFPTKVEYVGYTREPEVRPTRGKHEGLTQILHRVSNEDNDILVSFNLFKVTSYASGSPTMLNFMFANAMTDEVTVDLEGKILEKCFIMYFDSENQSMNKTKERAELVNNLKRLGRENRIGAVHIRYEPEGTSLLSTLCSSNVAPTSRHVFTVSLKGEDLSISPGSSYFE